jgi:hypothetical protein
MVYKNLSQVKQSCTQKHGMDAIGAATMVRVQFRADKKDFFTEGNRSASGCQTTRQTILMCPACTKS